MGILKGRTAIRIFNRFRKLKQKPYWGARGYCVDTVGLDAEKNTKICKISGSPGTQNRKITTKGDISCSAVVKIEKSKNQLSISGNQKKDKIDKIRLQPCLTAQWTLPHK